MSHLDDDGNLVDNYEEWLVLAETEDSEETRGWYDCPLEKSADYIAEHSEWWKNFQEKGGDLYGMV